ncbi:alpha-(1,3)-fucosyltransferase 7-like isoform X2 [Liolophura sinensis]
MPATSKEAVQTFVLFIVVSALSYYLWDNIQLTQTRQVFVHPLPYQLLAANFTGNKTFIILDYVAYTIKGNEDYYIGNCLVTQNKALVDKAHAVVFATRKLRSKSAMPKVRHQWQRWVWLLDESPYHPVDGQPFKLTDFNYVYNWTMTYSSDSDVYCPYGWTKRKEEPEAEIPDLGKRDGLIAAVISNCGSAYVHNHRFEYLKELNNTAKVTLYGRCGKACKGYENGQQGSPCPEIKNHLFYLSFENSNCKEYISEKFYGNAISMGAVPIVMGARKEDYARVGPPNSFIHVKDFASPKHLGDYINSLSKNRTAYMKYHEWRKEYEVDYRVQFISRKVWPPLCDKLNADKGEVNVVRSLADFWKLSDCDGTKFW